MGGKALKNVELRRLDAAAYHALVPQVVDTVKKTLGHEGPICVIDAYRQKESFGDMDVLIGTGGLPEGSQESLARAFRSREWAHTKNSDVTSFELEGFQIDLIETPPESFEYCRSYMAWNDLGNLIGYIAREMRAKNTQFGLCVPVRSQDIMFDEVMVTRDPDRGLSFLGYDPVAHRRGFDTLEDIFRYAASTTYFHPGIFLDREKNSKARRREEKRTTHSGFMEWLQNDNGLGRYLKEQGRETEEFFSFGEDRSGWLKQMRAEFPDFSERYDETLLQRSRQEEALSILNRRKVGEALGIEGRELGELMRELRSRYGEGRAMVDAVLEIGEEGVIQDAKEIAGVKPPASRLSI